MNEDLNFCKINRKISLDKPHDHPPLVNCEKDIYIEIKEFKDKISKDSSFNPKGENDKIYERPLKVYDDIELAEYWKSWNSIRGSILYHLEKNGPKKLESLNNISLTGDYTQTKPFFR